ncbi:receptor activity-modifying protein 2 isoform X1 [Acanthopagrus latus]|uniref:receptor activity-modifying protein 2 isoform X1 n=1 Tax=Acanthopagrus latus TaxID=8177 RepID=UPI00187CE88B|nr:receptor activity-modifying protein 2 isoform X1 [Acanthopagrus latus]
MTTTSFSVRFSGCFVTLLIWAGCTSVVCLVDENSAVQPATTIGYHTTETMAANATYGKSTMSLGCGNNTHMCVEYCSICHEFSSVPLMECLSMLFDHLCLSRFEEEMTSLRTDWCTWSNVSGLYSNLSTCSEEISDCLLIPWPNPLVEQIFVDIHSKYFKDCPSEELSDPPPVIIFALVITPICLIPVMVSLVVLKTKNGDGSS